MCLEIQHFGGESRKTNHGLKTIVKKQEVPESSRAGSWLSWQSTSISFERQQCEPRRKKQTNNQEKMTATQHTPVIHTGISHVRRKRQGEEQKLGHLIKSCTLKQWANFKKQHSSSFFIISLRRYKETGSQLRAGQKAIVETEFMLARPSSVFTTDAWHHRALSHQGAYLLSSAAEKGTLAFATVNGLLSAPSVIGRIIFLQCLT